MLPNVNISFPFFVQTDIHDCRRSMQDFKELMFCGKKIVHLSDVPDLKLTSVGSHSQEIQSRKGWDSQEAGNAKKAGWERGV